MKQRSMSKAGAPVFDLTGKVSLVTGAGRGLGHHIALALAAYGSDVVICDLTLAELEQTRNAVQHLGRRAYSVQADVTKIHEIHAMVEKAVDEFGHIDILVNNAGIIGPQWAVDVTEETWDRVIGTNLKGVFFCAQAVGRVMIGQKSGKIINISSAISTVVMPQRATYCTSKGGVNQLTKLLAVEWGPYNINVNAIAPATIKTQLTEQLLKNKEFHHRILDKIILGRLAEPSDVTGAVIYLASSASDFVTGHVLHVDGGWTIQ